MRQEDTWRWSSHLGKQTEGKCSKCDAPIYFEKQNQPFNKVCNRCGIGVPDESQKVP
jgi:predicted amidophosphoribosyltransferase